MNPLTQTMKQAMVGMGLQSARIGVTSENISNADTPGYQRKLIVPQAGGRDGAFQRAMIELDQTPGESLYDPAHPMADDAGYVLGSNVSLVIEMADMREANRIYEANLNSFQQAKTMYRSLLDVLRR